MKPLTSSLMVLALLSLPNISTGAEPPSPERASAPAPYYSVDTTPVGNLLDNLSTKAILDKYIPSIANDPRLNQARGMTLRDIQAYAPKTLTDQVMNDIQAELAKVPKPS